MSHRPALVLLALVLLALLALVLLALLVLLAPPYAAVRRPALLPDAQMSSAAFPLPSWYVLVALLFIFHQYRRVVVLAVGQVPHLVRAAPPPSLCYTLADYDAHGSSMLAAATLTTHRLNNRPSVRLAVASVRRVTMLVCDAQELSSRFYTAILAV